MTPLTCRVVRTGREPGPRHGWWAVCDLPDGRRLSALVADTQRTSRRWTDQTAVTAATEPDDDQHGGLLQLTDGTCIRLDGPWRQLPCHDRIDSGDVWVHPDHGGLRPAWHPRPEPATWWTNLRRRLPDRGPEGAVGPWQFDHIPVLCRTRRPARWVCYLSDGQQLISARFGWWPARWDGSRRLYTRGRPTAGAPVLLTDGLTVVRSETGADIS